MNCAPWDESPRSAHGRAAQARRSDRTRAESMASPAHLAGFDLLRQRLSVYFGEDEEPAWYEGAVDDYEHDGTYGYTCTAIHARLYMHGYTCHSVHARTCYVPSYEHDGT